MGCPGTLSHSTVIIKKETAKLGEKIFRGYCGLYVDNFASMVCLATTAAPFPDTNNFSIVIKGLVHLQKYLPGKEFIKGIQPKGK